MSCYECFYECSFCYERFNSIHNIPWPNSRPEIKPYGLDYAHLKMCHSCYCKFEIDSKYKFHQCHICQSYDHDAWIKDGPLMREAKLCFNCFIWQGKVNIKNDPRSIRIGSQHYMIEKDSDKPGWGDGHGGRLFNIQLLDGTIIKTRNLWSQGLIPEHWREQLKDNAKFLPDDSDMKSPNWEGFVDKNNSPGPNF